MAQLPWCADDITIGPSADLLLTGDLSVSFWFNAGSFPSGNSPDPVFTLTADAAASGTAKLAELAIDKNGDLVYAHEYGDHGSSEQTYTFSTANLSLDTWYNIALIRDADAGTKDVYLYLDDSLVDTYSYTQQPEGYTEGTLHIGGYTGANFDGTIDEFAIFGSTLTSQNVTDIYNAAQVPEPTTVCLLALGGMVLLGYRRK
ncbi:LamG-like jellyroll fold domain-containing protein [Planctomycetota bacterium]